MTAGGHEEPEPVGLEEGRSRDKLEEEGVPRLRLARVLG